MTLLIAGLLIFHLGLWWPWYILAALIWLLHIGVHVKERYDWANIGSKNRPQPGEVDGKPDGE